MTDEEDNAASFEDEVDEFQEPELGEDIDEDLEDGDLEDLGDEDLADEDDDALVDDEFADEVAPAEPSDEEPTEERRPPRARAAGDDKEEEDEEELDPNDVEADLDTILKDRLVTSDDEDEEEEEIEVDDRGNAVDRIQPKRPGEFVCQSCFLVKHPSQLADATRQFCRDCV